MQYETLLRVYDKAHPRQGNYFYGLPGPRVNVLTTQDYKHTDQLKAEPIVTDFSNVEATRNAAGFLNIGLQELMQKGNTHAFLLASGYHHDVRWMPHVLEGVTQSVPDQDIYFFIEPNSLHLGFDWEELKSTNQPIDMYSRRQNLFPSESLALINLETVFPLEEEMSPKGALGEINGVPLGGIELLATIIQRFSQTRTPLKMCGIHISYFDRNKKFYFTEWPPIYDLYPELTPAEATATDIKFQRRPAVIDAMLAATNQTPEDYNNMFADTVIIDGNDFMFTAYPK